MKVEEEKEEKENRINKKSGKRRFFCSSSVFTPEEKEGQQQVGFDNLDASSSEKDAKKSFWACFFRKNDYIRESLLAAEGSECQEILPTIWKIKLI